jgi:vacuolar-type H+-ATPase subunit H
MGKWDYVVEVARREAEAYFNQYGTTLTLRGLFYILVSKNVIPNTVTAYHQLSAKLAQARYEGRFPWHLLRDTTRRSIKLEKETQYPDRPLTADELKSILEYYIKNYTNVSVNPWEDQHYRIIVVVEKEALGDLVAKFIEEVWPYGVYAVRVIRGYDSATDVYNLAETIAYLPENQKPIILQLGDYDPSGEDIVRDLRSRLSMLSRRSDIIFEKVAVTLDQIVQLQLPAKPESMDEVQKMRRDPRYKGYIERLTSLAQQEERVKKLIDMYGSPEIRVELDALVALAPERFKEILRTAIEKYFDWQTYNDVTKKREEELRRKAEEVRRKTMEEMSKMTGGSTV